MVRLPESCHFRDEPSLHSLLVIGIGAAVFASTNMDNFALLVALYCDRSSRPVHIVAGQFIGMAFLIAVSVLGAAAARSLPLRTIGIVGILPIAIGIRMLAPSRSVVAEEPAAERPAGASRLIAVAGMTIANGGDNIGAYVPLFASRSRLEVGVLAGLFLVLTGAWCLAAHRFSTNRFLAAAAERYGSRLLPWVYIAIGMWVVGKYGAALPPPLPQ